MGYSNRPNSQEQVVEMATGAYAQAKIASIVELYNFLTSEYNIDRPLLLEAARGKGGNEVKVLPTVYNQDNRLNILPKDEARRRLQRLASTSLSIKFGVGSAGGSRRYRYNMGDASEGVIAAAIAARFINKSKRVTQQDVTRVLDSLQPHVVRRGNAFSVSHTFKSENYRTSKESKRIIPDDDVLTEIALAESNMALVFPGHFLADDPEERDQALYDRSGLIFECISYANSREISQLANVMYYNRVYDRIHIKADGLSGQTETKVDVNLTINGAKTIDIPARYNAPKSKDGLVTSQRLNITQISLKREVNQFAQVGGWDIETAQDLWGLILDEQITSNPDLLRYYEIQQNTQHDSTHHHAAAVMRNVYIWANRRLQTKFTSPAWRTHFVNTIHDFATKNEEYVQLVELRQGGVFEKYDMRKLELPLNGNTELGVPPNLVLSSRIITTSPQSARARPLPVVVLSVTNTNNGMKHDILQVRHKIEWSGTAVRNYIEKRDGLHQYTNALI